MHAVTHPPPPRLACRQFVESTEQATPLADKAGTVLASAKALVSVPLLVAPVLKAKQLGEIENLQVTYEVSARGWVAAARRLSEAIPLFATRCPSTRRCAVCGRTRI